jgi:hypothetical protein
MTTLRLDRANAVWREIDGEIVVLGNGGSDYMAINETGVLLWSRLEAGATIDELVSAITEVYEVTPEMARVDVEEFVAELRKRALLEPA